MRKTIIIITIPHEEVENNHFICKKHTNLFLKAPKIKMIISCVHIILHIYTHTIIKTAQSRSIGEEKYAPSTQ
jgi:hypothetical protein